MRSLRLHLVVIAGFVLAAAPWPRAVIGASSLDGKKLFTEKACIACHSVGGPSNGPGPELTQVGYQRDAVWLHAWLTDPQKIKKGTIMPKPAWKSPQEMDAVVDYLLSAKRPIPAADSSDGAKLFADYECSACHSIHKKGGKPQFPDLATEAKVHDAAWLDRWLQNPSAVKPGTFMATFPLTPTQRKALVQYIGSLDKK
jgi:nitric oxide reductase subunit C